MRRCALHGHFGCATYECQRAETERNSAAWIALRNETPPPAEPAGQQHDGYATGGPIDATGDPTDDSIPFPLMRDYHTWPTSEQDR